MKKIVLILLVAITIAHSCSKDNLTLGDDEFLVTFLDESSKCHGVLIQIQEEDRERILKIINGVGEDNSSDASLVIPRPPLKIGVFMLEGEYLKGQQLVLKLRKPDDSYNSICTAEVIWYPTAFVVEERVY